MNLPTPQLHHEPRHARWRRLRLAGALLAISACVFGVWQLFSTAKKNPNPADLNANRLASEQAKLDAQLRWKLLMADREPSYQRLELASQISAKPLHDEDFSALIDVLHYQPAAGTEPQAWEILNEVMMGLRLARSRGTELPLELGKLAIDPKAHEVVRDYATQHLIHWLAAADPADSSARHTALHGVVAAMMHPLNINTSLPGSALVTLSHARASLRKEEELASLDAELGPFLSSLLKQPPAPAAQALSVSQGESLRVSALHYLALSGQRVFLTDITALARDPLCPPGMKLAAISALGSLACESSRSVLLELAGQPDLFSGAAAEALNKISNISSNH